MTRSVEEALRNLAAAFAEERDRAAAEARRELASRLNRSARRLRQATGHDEWISALCDAAAACAARAAVFSLQGGFLHLERAAFQEAMPDIPLHEAPAFETAAATGDPVAALYGAQELSATLVEAFGESSGGRVQIFPVLAGGRAVAMIYAEGGGSGADANTLELLTMLAGAVWESRAAQPRPASSPLVAIQPAAVPGQAPPAPIADWAEIPPEDREAHLRAQRFARVHVAEIRLYKSPLVLEGRKRRALYAYLQEDIDRGRDIFKSEFVDKVPSMADYFHGEIVRTLANDDATLLGENYPGPLR
jgi:hypothetical protein